jgi:hypothetical protein
MWRSSLQMLLLLPTLLISQLLLAQKDIKKMPIQLAAITNMDVGDPISYSPGMFLDVGIRLAGSSREKSKFGATQSVARTKDRDFYLKPFLGFYKREDYHTAVMVGTDLTFRSTGAGGFFWDANIGAGYMHLFFNAPVYVFENGTFEEKKFQGYANVIAKGSVNFGWDFGKANDGLPIGVYTGAGFFFRYPNNSNWVRSPYLQLGIMYTLKKDKK